MPIDEMEDIPAAAGLGVGSPLSPIIQSSAVLRNQDLALRRQRNVSLFYVPHPDRYTASVLKTHFEVFQTQAMPSSVNVSHPLVPQDTGIDVTDLDMALATPEDQT